VEAGLLRQWGGILGDYGDPRSAAGLLNRVNPVPWLTGPVATDDYGNEIPHDASSLASLINSLVPHPAQSQVDQIANTVGAMLPVGGIGTARDLLRGPAAESVLRAIGYHGTPEAPPGAATHELARQNAVTMLGLPENNTAMDRARALGFNVDRPVYHSTKADFEGFDLSPAEGSRRGIDYGIHAGSPEAAQEAIIPSFVERNRRETAMRADLSPEMQREQLAEIERSYQGQRVLPLLARGDNPLVVPDFGRWDQPNNALVKLGRDYAPSRLKENLPTNDPQALQEILDLGRSLRTADWDAVKPAWQKGLKDIIENRGYSHIEYPNAIEGQGEHSYMFLHPERLRSRFAAFDPAKAHLPDLLAGVGAGAIGLDEFFKHLQEQKQ